MQTPRLIIFDFDGTLADSADSVLWTYHTTFTRLGLPARTDAQCRATIGVPLKEGFKQLFPEFSPAELNKCIDTYRKIYSENEPKLIPALFPGVKPTLTRLHEMGIEMAVASSRSRASLHDFLNAEGMTTFFASIIGADDVVHPKPDPEPVLKTLDRLNVKAEDAWVVGDMPVDIHMGRGAGCLTIGVSYGNSGRESLENAGAWKVIDHFPDLLTLLQ